MVGKERRGETGGGEMKKRNIDYDNDGDHLKNDDDDGDDDDNGG
jgi:hypothetical protein